METLSISAEDTSSRVKPEGFESYTEGTSIFIEQMQPKEFWNFQDLVTFKHNEDIQGTTISVKSKETEKNNPEDDYEVGYFNDDYDIVAKVPFKESFKIKVKIRSISKLQPKVFIDTDELDQEF